MHRPKRNNFFISFLFKKKLIKEHEFEILESQRKGGRVLWVDRMFKMWIKERKENGVIWKCARGCPARACTSFRKNGQIEGYLNAIGHTCIPDPEGYKVLINFLKSLSKVKFRSRENIEW